MIQLLVDDYSGLPTQNLIKFHLTKSKNSSTEWKQYHGVMREALTTPIKISSSKL